MATVAGGDGKLEGPVCKFQTREDLSLHMAPVEGQLYWAEAAGTADVTTLGRGELELI